MDSPDDRPEAPLAGDGTPAPSGRWDLRSVAGVAVLATAVAATAAGLVGSPLGGGSDEDAQTVVRSVLGTVALVQGCDDATGTPLATGDALADGAVVRSAPGSGAVLGTAGRSVELAPSSCLVVRDGVQQELRSGLVLVDTRGGPELALRTTSATLRTADAVVRVDSGTALRVASYAGSASVQPVGRRAVTEVPGLFETSVPQGGLPGEVTALRLTPRDSWEARPDVAGALVTADADYERLARGLDGPGGDGERAEQAVPAVLRTTVPTLSDARPSETALGYAIAAAAASPEPASEDYRVVRAGREALGSWGVVAAIVAARPSPTSERLDQLIGSSGAGTDPGAGAPGLPVAAPVAPDDLFGGVVDEPVDPPVTGPVAPPTPGPTRPRPTVPPATPPTTPIGPTPPRPTPTPSPTQDLVGGLLDTVGGLLGGLVGGAPSTGSPGGGGIPVPPLTGGSRPPAAPVAPAPSDDLVDGLLDLLTGG